MYLEISTVILIEQIQRDGVAPPPPPEKNNSSELSGQDNYSIIVKSQASADVRTKG